MSLLTTATAVEDSCFDVVIKVEDAVLHAARTFAEGFEPMAKRLPERPTDSLLPAPAEIVTHTFDLLDRLVANLRDFSSQLVGVVSTTAEAPRTPAKAAPKAHAA
jgi:hypothetical protein